MATMDERERDDWRAKLAAMRILNERAQERATFWQARFHTLRLENNALRKQANAARRAGSVPLDSARVG